MTTLTDHQWEAVRSAVDWYKNADTDRAHFEAAGLESFMTEGTTRSMLGRGQDFFLGGYAGTGKSTILPALIEELGLSPEQVAFCAPTGKAAKVMGDKLKAFGMYVTPTTIHKLIYVPKRARADAIKSQIDGLSSAIVNAKAEMGATVRLPDGRDVDIPTAEQHLAQLNFDLMRAMEDDDSPKFMLRMFDEFPEHAKLIVVDEGSMVGHRLAEDLSFFGRPILALGDPGQLPPVGDDYGFNCHHPDAFLTEIHRQAKDNPIIRLSVMAREGKDLRIGDYGDGVKVVDRRDDDVTFNMDRDAMVLAGTHKKRWSLTKKIRTALGHTETGPGEGEPLLFCKNSTKLPSMVNGTLVTCMTDCGDLLKGSAVVRLRIKDEEGGGAEHDIACAQAIFEEHITRKRNTYSAPSHLAFKAKRECEQVDWGHVLTVHKSQGSQWDDVVVHDESGVFRSDAPRWLYTAVTRAAKHLTVVV